MVRPGSALASWFGENREHETRVWLQTRNEAESRKLNLLRDRIIQTMVAYKEEFKLDTTEIDASIEAVFEYRNMLDKLQAYYLPRFEARFNLDSSVAQRVVAGGRSQLCLRIRPAEAAANHPAHSGCITRLPGPVATQPNNPGFFR